MTQQFEADLTGAAFAAALLTIEHLTLYPKRDQLHPTARYAIGVLALAAGHTLACALVGDTRAALRLWLIVASGGSAVLALYAARGELPESDDVLRDIRQFLMQ